MNGAGPAQRIDRFRACRPRHPDSRAHRHCPDFTAHGADRADGPGDRMNKLLACILFALSLLGCDSEVVNITSKASALNEVSTGSEVRLSWVASTGGVQGYLVEQSSDNVNFSQIQALATNTALISGLKGGNTYYFRVRAYNQAGPSPYSSTVTVQQ